LYYPLLKLVSIGNTVENAQTYTYQLKSHTAIEPDGDEEVCGWQEEKCNKLVKRYSYQILLPAKINPMQTT